MNHDLIIKTTNRVALYATIALIYWVFVFLLITVFDLKIFRERISGMFVLSILGIFAVLGGAIVLNFMSNLSKISAAVAPAEAAARPLRSAPWTWALAAHAIPLLAAGVFVGDHLSAERKRDMLVGSAERLVQENQEALGTMADYRFSVAYIDNATRTLTVLRKIDKHFPEVWVVVPDEIDGKQVYLGFGGRYYDEVRTRKPKKSEFVISTSRDEREYLAKVFAGEAETSRFEAQDGNYDLYFPVKINGRTLVLYFSDYQRYGKFGS